MGPEGCSGERSCPSPPCVMGRSTVTVQGTELPLAQAFLFCFEAALEAVLGCRYIPHLL